MRAMLDDVKDISVPDDPNEYFAGTVPAAGGGTHDVVVGLLKKMGNNQSTATATNMRRSFPNVADVLVVGIGYGCPSPLDASKHIRLGDIVVSNQNGVIQVDLIKLENGKPTVRSNLSPPSAHLLGKVQFLEARKLSGLRPWEGHIRRADSLRGAVRPQEKSDQFILDESGKKGKHPRDRTRTQSRGWPQVHLGCIASANTLLKDAAVRNHLRDTYGIRAGEMEAAGVADAVWTFGNQYLVIRGICDYADSLKNDAWQEYAAIVAAAYARALLESIPRKSDSEDSVPSHDQAERRFRQLPGEPRDFTEHGTEPPAPKRHWFSGLPLDFSTYIRNKTTGFVGRAHFFARVQSFISSVPSGYLTIVGNPGVGKTSMLCELTRRMDCVAHFFIRSEGITRADQFYTSIGEQLQRRFGADAASGSLDMSGVRLTTWLTQAVESLNGDPLILVVDALDECDDASGKNRLGNLLLLPRALPDGVYVLLARRDLDPIEYHIRLETEVDVANEIFDLMEYPAENRHDIEQYLHAYFIERHDDPWLGFHHISAQKAVAILTERSECNFMYLRYVLPHLRANPHEFAPETLPKGLEEYYRGHWTRMTTEWRTRPEAQHVFDTIYVLAENRRPMTRALLAEVLPDIDDALVSVFISQWREFLDYDDGVPEPAFRIYHTSFADFLAKLDAVQSAGRRQARAARFLLDWFMGYFPN